MKIRELLGRLDDVALESLAADKIDDVIHLRLPREVLIDEIADTIASYSYVTEAIGKRHPPCFEILDLLMKADGFRVPIDGFKASVHSRISEISSVADSDDSLAIAELLNADDTYNKFAPCVPSPLRNLHLAATNTDIIDTQRFSVG